MVYLCLAMKYGRMLQARNKNILEPWQEYRHSLLIVSVLSV